MMGKLSILAGVGVGYVLGARAGRERYEQISDGVRRLWRDPRVAEKRSQAAHLAKDQAVAAKDAVSDKVSDTVHKSSGGSSSGSSGGSSGTQSVSASDLPDAPSYPV